MIELITADKRKIRVDDFISKLRKNINSLPGLETLIVRAPRGGPPGRDLDIRILGNDLNELKLHAQKIINIASSLPGASDLEEDLNYGTEELFIPSKINFKGVYLNKPFSGEADQMNFYFLENRISFNKSLMLIFDEKLYKGQNIEINTKDKSIIGTDKISVNKINDSKNAKNL